MPSDSLEDRIAQVVRETMAPLRTEIVEQVVAALGATQRPEVAEWLSTADVARELGVTPETVRDYVKRGKLKASKVERAHRVHRDDLRRFLAGETVDGEQKVAALTDRLRGLRGGR
jgi:excisionase family DNA binding protein